MSKILILVACLGLLLATGAAAQAGPTITITWSFQQDTVNPATTFVIRRCVQTSAGCPMADLQGATQIPISTLSFIDPVITPGVTYCYQMAAANVFGRGPLSIITCGVIGTPPSTSPQNVTLKLSL